MGAEAINHWVQAARTKPVNEIPALARGDLARLVRGETIEGLDPDAFHEWTTGDEGPLSLKRITELLKGARQTGNMELVTVALNVAEERLEADTLYMEYQEKQHSGIISLRL